MADSLRERAADEVREVVLDGLRSQQSVEDEASDLGVDESGMDYMAMVDAVLKHCLPPMHLGAER